MSNITVEVNGEERQLTDNPSMGTVKEVQKMQMNILAGHLDDDTLSEVDALSEDEIMDTVMESGGFAALQEMMWDQSVLETAQTISLALDEKFTVEDINELSSNDFLKLREGAEEALDGDAADFMRKLGVGTNLTEQEIQRRMQAVQNDDESD